MRTDVYIIICSVQIGNKTITDLINDLGYLYIQHKIGDKINAGNLIQRNVENDKTKKIGVEINI